MNNPTLAFLAIFVASTVRVGLPDPTELPSSHGVCQGRSIPYCSPFTGYPPLVKSMSNQTSSTSYLQYFRTSIDYQ